ncbi:hypothetical protein [Pseudomonas phoenicis]|uniref:hypothetical protein n=1 Tax=unclassified Pseudomonas TaxID=196821 RepID=UPI0039A0F2E4
MLLLRLMTTLSVVLLCTSQAQAAQCAKTVYEPGYRKTIPTVDSPEFITVAGPLLPGGRVTCHVSFDLVSGNHNVMHRIETGTLNSTKYRFHYSDGSGTVQGLQENVLDILKDKYGENWNLRCRKDEMDDTHYCAMSRGPLTIGVYGHSSRFVSVGSEHFPGSSITLRIDEDVPVTALAKPGFSSLQETGLMAAMSKGTSVLTRYVKWPYESNQDKRVSLFGFNPALQIIETLNKTIK